MILPDFVHITPVIQYVLLPGRHLRKNIQRDRYLSYKTSSNTLINMANSVILERLLPDPEKLTAPGTIRLNLLRIYVLPTRQGIIFSILLLAMLFGSINYNNTALVDVNICPRPEQTKWKTG